ncbi:MAG: retroviral-like aspartic protease family protein [Chloroflexota bacterium]|nr:retroviral-like aspartic protease family protein [Chloroflexota bacterium]
MNKYPYDATYDPPIPACDVALTAPSTGRRVTLTAIVDTGADGTIVPVHYLHRIGARRSIEATLRSQWGEPRTVFLYLVNLQVGELALPGIYVVGDELGDEIVLGRNVLNRLRLLLDGPVALTQLLNEEF